MVPRSRADENRDFRAVPDEKRGPVGNVLALTDLTGHLMKLGNFPFNTSAWTAKWFHMGIWEALYKRS